MADGFRRIRLRTILLQRDLQRDLRDHPGPVEDRHREWQQSRRRSGGQEKQRLGHRPRGPDPVPPPVRVHEIALEPAPERGGRGSGSQFVVEAHGHGAAAPRAARILRQSSRGSEHDRPLEVLPGAPPIMPSVFSKETTFRTCCASPKSRMALPCSSLARGASAIQNSPAKLSIELLLDGLGCMSLHSDNCARNATDCANYWCRGDILFNDIVDMVKHFMK